MKEIWLPVRFEGFEKHYVVSNFGRVRSVTHKDSLNRIRYGLIRKTYVNKQNGYEGIQLKANGKKKSTYIHRLVAEAFVPNQDSKEQINHVDGDKLNNRSDNLEWVTGKENLAHAVANGLHAVKGTDNPMAKLSEQDVLAIRSLIDTHRFTQQRIADMFGIKQTVVSRIGLGKSWRHMQEVPYEMER